MVVKWIAKHNVYTEYLASQIFCESIENCCWQRITLIWRKAVAVGKHNSYRP